jgi:hypothetical protein
MLSLDPMPMLPHASFILGPPLIGTTIPSSHAVTVVITRKTVEKIDEMTRSYQGRGRGPPGAAVAVVVILLPLGRLHVINLLKGGTLC